MGVKDQLAAEESSDTTTGSRVWGPRVDQGPIINSTPDASERWGSDWTNSTLNTWMSKSDAVGLYGKLPEWQQSMFQSIADASTSGMDSGRSVYERYVDSASAFANQGERRTPAELALADIQSGAVSADVSGESKSRGGSRGYSGPVAQTTFMDERDVDRTANALALTLIGRPLSAKEMSKVTERLRAEERANPTVTTPGVGSSVTQSGLSAEGRADVLREVIAENPEYQQFQVDTTVLDTMLSELNKREQMVNGR